MTETDVVKDNHPRASGSGDSDGSNAFEAAAGSSATGRPAIAGVGAGAGSVDALDVRARARAAVSGLQALWGDELPPGTDPVHTVIADAVCLDDEHGRAQGLVVLGDGLSTGVRARLLRAGGSWQDRLLLLPPALAQRLVGPAADASWMPGED